MRAAVRHDTMANLLLNTFRTAAARPAFFAPLDELEMDDGMNREAYEKFRVDYGSTYLRDEFLIAWLWLVDAEWEVRHEVRIYDALVGRLRLPKKKYLMEVLTLALETADKE